MAKIETTYEDICRDIKAGKFSPVYMLMGEEPYFIDMITDLLIQHVLDEAERDFNQIIMYGADTNSAEIINAARRFPMMSKYQLVVVKEAQQIRDIDVLTAYMKKPLASTILVLNYKYKSLDRRKSLASMIEKVGVLYDSKKIPDYKMVSFIPSFASQKGLNIDTKSAQMLSDFVGNNISRLNKELDKLLLLINDKKVARVTPEIIERNIGISKEYNTFELLHAIVIKDALKTYRIAQYYDKNPKDNPIQKIFPMLFNYFSNLFICYYTKDRSQNGLMIALGLKNAFQVKDYLIGMKNYSAMKTFKIISYIREADARSKGVGRNSMTDADIMKELLYKILH